MQIIDVYLKLVSLHAMSALGRKVYAFSTYFFESFLKGSHLAVSRHTKTVRWRMKCSIKECDSDKHLERRQTCIALNYHASRFIFCIDVAEQVNIFEMDVVLFPVHLTFASVTHWALVAADIKGRTLRYFDSILLDGDSHLQARQPRNGH